MRIAGFGKTARLGCANACYADSGDRGDPCAPTPGAGLLGLGNARRFPSVDSALQWKKSDGMIMAKLGGIAGPGTLAPAIMAAGAGMLPPLPSPISRERAFGFGARRQDFFRAGSALE